jgi:hypothetical protein
VTFTHGLTRFKWSDLKPSQRCLVIGNAKAGNAILRRPRRRSYVGRLTLNVLLSFAQFEREVTSERIRDKIAASKRKGFGLAVPSPSVIT